MGMSSVISQALGLLALMAPSLAQGPVPSNAKLEAAWEKLPQEARQEVIQWYQAELVAVRTYQGQLVTYVLEAVDHDPRDWPAATADPPLYRAEVHAPAQVIPRKFVAKPTRSQRAWIERVFRARASPLHPPGSTTTPEGQLWA